MFKIFLIISLIHKVFVYSQDIQIDFPLEYSLNKNISNISINKIFNFSLRM